MSKDRFGFGKNWKDFLQNLDETKIKRAEDSLKEWLKTDDLSGKDFLDIGSGSGLFSLAARRMGARVFSFDYDQDSVDCTNELKRRYFDGDPNWNVERGDALDEKYLEKYGKCDIVYSWGVLHHTGNMYKGLENAGNLVKDGGILFIAIYNDQGKWSKCWSAVKKTYNLLPGPSKYLVLGPAFVRLWGPTTVRDIVKLQPFHRWKTYKEERGMSPWIDVVDWVGGWPFEVAKPEEIMDFYTERGFVMDKLYTCGGGHGCNQFLFHKK
ncbi:class I SAM-dependent methyltransferase [Butyrivibrio sp. FCS014]|uniref:class I SAM-dependent methyltransferase n=1 Tax=Butyrivibrio sp. FCS014 TaxID=1408304 RepID=UPI0004670E67|nr:class I SAM-dependent methyltransferase [Butyrivibrio sp. FCS014]